MKTDTTIERWDWPILKAEPSGFDYIEISINEPSQQVFFKATVPLESAVAFGQHLIVLVEKLRKAREEG